MDLKFIEKLHGRFIQERRVNVLCAHIAELLPRGARVLDVGCGDGWLAHLIQHRRPDVVIRGLDVLVRPKTHVPVTQFDGIHIPEKDGSYDVVMFVDVLHHTEDPNILLAEAARVARQAVVVKDHTCDGLLAFKTLKFMDDVGNKRYGVVLPYNYWPEAKWREAFQKIGVTATKWKSRLGLYPLPLNLFFERSLHFIGKLEPIAARRG